MFIDRVTVRVAAGNGGSGISSFRREKFAPLGGPDGGDGGKGGDVIIVGDNNLATLLDFTYRDSWEAESGKHGSGSNKTGASGADIILPVPPGTIVRNKETNEIVGEVLASGDEFVVAKGGRGGKGNAWFATSVHRSPREWQPGEDGEQRTLELELKLIADVGLVGQPNAGKSTLLSVISAARPKIADYPFTTLEPNLGLVSVGEQFTDEEVTFVVADVPGLIEGAHEGAGLGTQFLRHIERTRLIAHLVDVSDASGRPDPVKDVEVISGELASFGAHLEDKPVIMVASKIDAVNKDKLAKLKRYCKKHNLELFEISAVTGAGIEALKWAMAKRVVEVRKEEALPTEEPAEFF